jgi:hypothetical protein
LVARAGTSLAAIESDARAGQMLAFEPPHFGKAQHSAALSPADCPDHAGPTQAPCATSFSACVLDGIGDDLAFGGRVRRTSRGSTCRV